MVDPLDQLVLSGFAFEHDGLGFEVASSAVVLSSADSDATDSSYEGHLLLFDGGQIVL